MAREKIILNDHGKVINAEIEYNPDENTLWRLYLPNPKTNVFTNMLNKLKIFLKKLLTNTI